MNEHVCEEISFEHISVLEENTGENPIFLIWLN